MKIKEFEYTAILGWSSTRYDIFSECKRKYYYQYYAKFDKEYQKHNIDFLKGLTSIPMEKRYKEAWGRPRAVKSMINWYRAAFRSLKKAKGKGNVTVPTLMLWGKLDTALGSEMAQPSIDLCEDGKLIFFEDATHWVQHEKAEDVNKHLLEFFWE